MPIAAGVPKYIQQSLRPRARFGHRRPTQTIMQDSMKAERTQLSSVLVRNRD